MNKTLFALTTLVAAGSAHAAMFRLTVENLGPQPLSPTFYSASDSSFDIFALGSGASVGIKNIAESGNTTAMLGIAAGAGSSVSTYGALTGGPIVPGGTRTTLFSADEAHGYFSFASMLGKTNDGFVGESVSSMGLRLFASGAATGFNLVVDGRRAWDAGTELNTQNAADLGFLGGAGNPAEAVGSRFVRVHGGILAGVGDSWNQMPAWTHDTQLARVTVTPVPEPATIATLALGAATLVRRRRRSTRRIVGS